MLASIFVIYLEEIDIFPSNVCHLSCIIHGKRYVPADFEALMDDTVQEWESLGIMRKWKEVKKPKNSMNSAETYLSPWTMQLR